MGAADQFQANLMSLQAKAQEQAKIAQAKLESQTQQGLIKSGVDFMQKFQEEQQAAREAKAQGAGGPATRVQGISQPVNPNQLQAGTVGNQGPLAPIQTPGGPQGPQSQPQRALTDQVGIIGDALGGSSQQATNQGIEESIATTVGKINEIQQGGPQPIPDVQEVPEPSGAVKAFFEKQLIGATGRERALRNNDMAAGIHLQRLQAQQAPLDQQVQVLRTLVGVKTAITNQAVESRLGKESNIKNAQERMSLIEKSQGVIENSFGKLPPFLQPGAIEALIAGDLGDVADLITASGAAPLVDDIYQNDIQLDFAITSEKQANVDNVLARTGETLQKTSIAGDERQVRLGLLDVELAEAVIEHQKNGASLTGDLADLSVESRQSHFRLNMNMGREQPLEDFQRKFDDLNQQLVSGVPLPGAATTTISGGGFFGDADEEGKFTTMTPTQMAIKVDHVNRWNAHHNGDYALTVGSSDPTTTTFDSGRRLKTFSRQRTIEHANTIRQASNAIDPGFLEFIAAQPQREGEDNAQRQARLNGLVMQKLHEFPGAKKAVQFIADQGMQPLLFANELYSQGARKDALDGLLGPNGKATQFIVLDVDTVLDNNEAAKATFEQLRKHAPERAALLRKNARRKIQSEIGRTRRAPGL
jgi:hypothetical protein